MTIIIINISATLLWAVAFKSNLNLTDRSYKMFEFNQIQR